jgi:hypothetical protein
MNIIQILHQASATKHICTLAAVFPQLIEGAALVISAMFRICSLYPVMERDRTYSSSIVDDIRGLGLPALSASELH